MASTTIRIKEEAAKIAARSYTREIVPNEDGSWFARIIELPGCMTEGDTAEEAFTNLEDAMLGWIEVHLADGAQIPPPLKVDAFSGKFLVRVAKSLHRDLSRAADFEGVSLNAYVNTQLARILGRP